MIAQIDDQFARILDCLEKTGQRENTIIIFIRSWGNTWDHGLVKKGCRFYEGLTQFPSSSHGRSHFAKGVACEGLVELLDLLNTKPFSILQVLRYQTIIRADRFDVLRREDGSKIREVTLDASIPHDALDAHFTGGTGTFATMYRTGDTNCPPIDHGLGNCTIWRRILGNSITFGMIRISAQIRKTGSSGKSFQRPR